MANLSLLFCLCLISQICIGATVKREFTVAHEIVDSIDFVTNTTLTRLGSFVDGVLPGPTIECNLGDKLEITFHNKMTTSSLTIHFHGQFQKNTFFYDGVHGVTQCEIPPGESFTYKFTAEPAGTFMYHSHLPYQYGDGIFGALIVHDPSDPFKNEYSDEIVFGINDWINAYSDQAYEFISQFRFDVWPLAYHTSFINGKDNPDPQIYSINPGQTYRLRFYHIGTEYSHRIQLAGHKFTVIALDGAYINPVENIDFINLAPGYRVDVLVTFNQDSSKSYELRARVINYKNELQDYYTSSIIRYGSSSTNSPVQALQVMEANEFFETTNGFTTFDEFDVTPYTKNGNYHSSYEEIVGPNKLTNEIYLATTSYNTDDYDNAKFVDCWDNEVYRAPEVPLVFSKGKFGTFPDEFVDITSNYDGESVGSAHVYTRTITLEKDQVVDIVFQNDALPEFPDSFTAASHPNHLHGHSFWVLGQGSGAFTDNDIGLLNFDNPILRDTISVYPHSWTAIRFIANNPGAWICHCHLETHAVFGMSVVFLSDTKNWPEIPGDFPLCRGVTRDDFDSSFSTSDSSTEDSSSSSGNRISYNILQFLLLSLAVQFLLN